MQGGGHKQRSAAHAAHRGPIRRCSGCAGHKKRQPGRTTDHCIDTIWLDRSVLVEELEVMTSEKWDSVSGKAFWIQFVPIFLLLQHKS